MFNCSLEDAEVKNNQSRWGNIVFFHAMALLVDFSLVLRPSKERKSIEL
jgi:hypothetical protein